MFSINQIIRVCLRREHNVINPAIAESIKSGKLVAGPIEESNIEIPYDQKSPCITIFGATGFFGQHLVEILAKKDYQIILPYRGDVQDIKSLRMIGTMGQNLFTTVSIEDDASIERAIRHSQMVINLIGRDFENRHFSFDQLHVEVPGRIARLAKKMGVSSFIHMSALGATEKPDALLSNTGSKYLRSKYLGEYEVEREFPGAAIIRPAAMWGMNDRFIFHFTKKRRHIRSWSNKTTIPLFCSGKNTIKQPVYGGDIAAAMDVIISDLLKNKFLTFRNNVFELAGPERFQLDHLVYWFFLNLRYDINKLDVCDFSNWFLLKSKWLPYLTPKYPLVTFDILEKESATEPEPSDLSITFNDLNVRPCRMEDRIHWLLKPYRGMGYSWDDFGGFEPPPCPPIAI